MELFGSLASPFVRRIRILLSDRDYKFTSVNVFTREGQQLLGKYTSTGRVPLLVDGDRVIWDSLLITKYIRGKEFDLEIEKELVLVNEATDSGMHLFQMRKFGTDPEDSGVFSQNSINRIKRVLDYFDNKNLAWNTVGQWLYCTLEWFSFRNIYEWEKEYPNLVKFRDENKDRPELVGNEPQ